MSTQAWSVHQMLIALSSLQEHALLHVSYPPEDFNRKSRSAVTHYLRETGLNEPADAIDNGAEYLVVSDVHEAIKVYNAIQGPTLALGVRLFWKGMQNEEVIGHVKASDDHLARLRPGGTVMHLR